MLHVCLCVYPSCASPRLSCPYAAPYWHPRAMPRYTHPGAADWRPVHPWSLQNPYPPGLQLMQRHRQGPSTHWARCLAQWKTICVAQAGEPEPALVRDRTFDPINLSGKAARLSAVKDTVLAEWCDGLLAQYEREECDTTRDEYKVKCWEEVRLCNECSAACVLVIQLVCS